MQDEVKPLGKDLVALEERLDRSFQNEEIDEEELARTTSEIATVEGRLRNAHLSAHLKVKEILNSSQIANYDRRRGYIEDDSEPSDERPPPSNNGQHSSHH